MTSQELTTGQALLAAWRMAKGARAKVALTQLEMWLFHHCGELIEAAQVQAAVLATEFIEKAHIVGGRIIHRCSLCGGVVPFSQQNSQTIVHARNCLARYQPGQGDHQDPAAPEH
jgi:hypothetical protein